jgi:hypothetical protein|tara:strand:- start:1753 stop:1923 length:171 start_codon:yes stop_codon:yes gene_type:complete
MDKNIQTIFIFTSGFFVGYFLKETKDKYDNSKNNTNEMPPYVRSNYLKKIKYRYHY